MNVKKMILFGWMGSGSSYTLYPSTDRAILAGSDGGDDYPGLGGFCIDPISSRRYAAYRLADDHAGLAGKIYLVASDDKFSTQATPILIKSDVALENVTNANCSVVNNRRVIVTWTRIEGGAAWELSGAGEIWYKYSDDLYSVADPTTATWSSELRLTLDYGELDTNSTTSINLNLVTIPSTVSINVGTGLSLGIVTGRSIKLASASDTNKSVSGLVLSYNSGTGALQFTATAKSGTTTHADWIVSMTTYIDGPGKAIQISGDTLWKPCWTTIGGTSSVVIYQSLDNGLTWTYHSLISDDSINPNDETCIVKLLNGNVMAFLRCNTLKVVRISTYSGSSWSALTNTTIPSEGKNPVVLTPDGRYVIGLGRDTLSSPVHRTIYFYNTTPNDFTQWTSDFIDNRYKYMYGGIDWDFNDDEAATVYAVASVNEVTDLTGPTLLIHKVVAYSQTPVTPPTEYNTSLRDVLDFAIGNYRATPSEALLDYYNDYFNGLVTDGQLTEHDFIFMLMQNDTNLQVFACQNWRKGWEVLTQVASPTYSVNGFDFNGTTQYLQYKALNTLTKFTQNNASMSCYVAQNVVEAGGAFGSGDGTFGTYTNSTWLRPRVLDTLEYAQFGVNQNFAGPVSSYAGSVLNSNSIGFWKISRTGANTSKLYKDASLLLTNSTTASSGRSSRPLLIGAVNFAVTPNHFGSKLIGYLDGGSAMDGYEATKLSRFNTFKTAIGL